MPETKQRRRSPSPKATHRPKPNIPRPRRTSTATQGRFARGLTFRRKPQPTAIERALGALKSSKPASKKGGAAATGALALVAGGLAALRKRRGGPETSNIPGPVTDTSAHPSANTR